jgi:hypothetical protein
VLGGVARQCEGGDQASEPDLTFLVDVRHLHDEEAAADPHRVTFLAQLAEIEVTIE